MGQIWAAIKSLGAIASLLSSLLEWLKDVIKERKLAQADEKHAQNNAAIDSAIDGVGLRVDGNGGKPSAKALEPSGLSDGESRRP